MAGKARVLRRAALAGTVCALAATGGLAGCGGSNQAALTVTVTKTVKPPAPKLTPAQRRARQARARAAAAKKKAAAQARAKARAKAAKKAAAAAAAAAAKHRAAVAAANAWHKGYVQQDGNVFWEWRTSGSCEEFATNGCWHIAVITRNGCPSYVGVNANEYKGSAIVGQLLANQGYGIPPKTVRIFELDADQGGPLKAGNVSVDCE
jgi:nucleoid-associated protein YgaU